MAKKPLDKWIAEAMNDTTKEGPCTALALVHMVGGNQNVGHSEVHTLKFGGTGSYEPRALADMFRNKAETYCQDMPGVQYFALWAMYGTNEPQAKQIFLVNVQADGWAGASEPPNDTGERMQNMRQKEMGFQQIFQRQQAMDNHSIRMIETMSGHMIRLMQENQDAWTVVKDVMQKQALDTHNLKMKELEFARSSEERKKWLSFAPPLINRLMGQEIFPQSTADTALIEKVADAITPEIAIKLSEVVPQELWGPLAGRLHEAQQKVQAEREATARLPRFTGDGEEDISGGMTRQ